MVLSSVRQSSPPILLIFRPYKSSSANSVCINLGNIKSVRTNLQCIGKIGHQLFLWCSRAGLILRHANIGGQHLADRVIPGCVAKQYRVVGLYYPYHCDFGGNGSIAHCVFQYYLKEKDRAENYSRTIQDQYRQQLYYMEALEQMIFRLKSERHDFNNHLGVIHGLLESGGEEKARAYARQLVSA